MLKNDMKRFSEIIGQNPVKETLDLLVRGHKNGAHIPALLLIAPMGSGKTMLAEEFGRYLTTDGKNPRPYSCISSASLKSKTDLTLLWQNKVEDQECTILFDECHGIAEEVSEILLNLLNPNDTHKNSVDVYLKGERYPLSSDFSKQTFIFATTDPQKLTLPFIDRLERIDLQNYTHFELSRIINKNLIKFNIKASNDALCEVSKVLRGNARAAQKMASKINLFMTAYQIKSFDSECWGKMKKKYNILPMGMSPLELRVLRALSKKDRTLQGLSSILTLAKSMVQRDVESFLTVHDLMEIDGKRKITKEGKKYLEKLDSTT